jgi:predicted nucleotidyltransferase
MRSGADFVLSADERRLVVAILAAHLPADAAVWVFGSRATGRAGRSSDLDLAVDAGHLLSWDELARLADDFRESDLPFRVDLVDWHGIGSGFKETIAAERVPLTLSNHVEDFRP